jgi:hypothetical protein
LRQFQVVGQITGKHAAENKDARHRTHQGDHAEHDVLILQYRAVADSRATLSVLLRLAKDEKQQNADDESWNRDNPKHHSP